jgi:hypothetical protein
MNLKEALKRGKLKQFAKEHESTIRASINARTS